jgi:alkanesulfonate monooxygenase SsuD/methylene tetrahydromethanopterin reductase-like flavin-dependent oxidoreductase (luciferase family)
MSDAALRRAARAGDHWQAVHGTVAQFRERREAPRMRAFAAASR